MTPSIDRDLAQVQKLVRERDAARAALAKLQAVVDQAVDMLGYYPSPDQVDQIASELREAAEDRLEVEVKDGKTQTK